MLWRLYIAAAALELLGLLLVALDIRRRRRRADALLAKIGNLPYSGARISGRATSPHVQKAEMDNRKTMENAIVSWLDEDAGGGWRSYIGPVVLAAGILLGAAGNIAAL